MKKRKKDLLKKAAKSTVLLFSVVALFFVGKQFFLRDDVRVKGVYEGGPDIYISGENSRYNSGGLVSLSSSEEPVVSVESYGVVSGDADVELYRADKQEVFNYLTHDKDFNQINKEIDWSKLEKVASFSQKLNKDESGQARITLPLENSGIWYMKLALGTAVQHALVVRSDVGVAVKEGDNEMVFWAQSFSTKKSIPGGTIKTYNLLNEKKKLFETVADGQGIAKTNISDQVDIATFEKDGSFSVIPINLRYINTGHDGRYADFKSKQVNNRYFIFTDRPIYQPGEKVYFKSIVRENDQNRFSIPSGKIYAEVYKGYGESRKIVFQGNYEVSSDGSVDGQFDIPMDVETGNYTLELSSKDGSGEDVFSWESGSIISFDIEYFQKPEYSLDISADKQELINGETATVSFIGKYFSGQNLNNGKVNYSIFASDFYDYSYYSDTFLDDFGSHSYGYYWGKEVDKGLMELDAGGIGKLTFEPAKYSGADGKNKIYSIEAELKDESGNPVVERLNVLVRAGKFDIFRTDRYSIAKVGSQANLKLALKPVKGGSVANVSLAVHIKRNWWEKIDDPKYKYGRYEKREDFVGDFSITSDQNGDAVLNFIPKVNGSYNIEIEAKDELGNTVKKTFYYYVSNHNGFYGEEQVGLTVKSEREKYLPNETAKLQIASTIENRDVLLTVERGRVDRYQVFRVDGGSRAIDLPLEQKDMPNVFVEVSSFSDSRLEQASQELEVSAEQKKLRVEVEADKERYSPGGTANIKVKIQDQQGNPVSAEAAVWAVDKAIFELADPGENDVFNAFWKKSYETAADSNSLLGIMVKAAEMGGCFDGQTKVLMSDGSEKNIQEIVQGEKILTRESENNGNLVEAEVIDTHQVETKGYFVVNDVLKVTPNHLLMVNGSWRRADKLKIGDWLVDSEGDVQQVYSLQWRAEKLTVFNLEVKDRHTFFAGDVWVHNGKDGSPRTKFENTAYWNPRVTTGSDGTANLSIKLPDNLTTWVLSAVASTRDSSFGQGTSEMLVTKETIIRPILPNVLRVGDDVVFSALAQNFSNQSRDYKIKLEFDSGTVEGGEQLVTLEPMASKQIEWEAKIEKSSEEAKLVFSMLAQNEDVESDIVEQRIPIWDFGFWDKDTSILNQSGSLQFNIFNDADRAKSSVNLSIASSIVGSLPSSMEYLIKYPYGCVEQTTSRFVPAVIAKENQQFYGTSIGDKNIDDIIREGIKRLQDLQNADGGWSWWSDAVSDPFVSVYVTEYLIRAQKLGFEVDPVRLTRLVGYFERKGTSQKDQASDIAIRSYGIKLLNPDRKGTLLAVDRISQPDILAMAVMTNLRNGFSNSEENGLDKLRSIAVKQGDVVSWKDSDRLRFGSADASSAMALKALIMSGDSQFSAQVARSLFGSRKEVYWSNTYGTARVIDALTDYYKLEKEQGQNYVYSVYLGDQLIKTAKAPAVDKNDVVQIPLEKIEGGDHVLTIKQEGAGNLYSSLNIEQFRTDRSYKATDHGISITREYYDQVGNQYISPAVGDLVTVRLRVSGLKSDSQYYAVLEDQLPAGMVPVNTNLKNQQTSNSQNYLGNYHVAEITQNGAIISTRNIHNGSYEYKARVVAGGEFSVPPARVELMYVPSVYGMTDAGKLKIGKEPVVKKAALSSLKNIGQGSSSKWIVVVLVALVFLLSIVLGYKKYKKRKENLNEENPNIEK